MNGNSMRPFEATASAWEFEQKRDVARALDSARRSTADFEGKPTEELGESVWIGRTNNTGLEPRVIRDSVLCDSVLEDDDYDEFYDR